MFTVIDYLSQTHYNSRYCPLIGCTKTNLLVDILDKLCSFLLLCVPHLPFCLPLCLPSGRESEVGLCIDVVEACSGHQQLSSL